MLNKRTDWKQVKTEDPEWVEWKKELMTKLYGRTTLRVWLSDDRCYRASMMSRFLGRGVRRLNAANIDDAKIEALCWILKAGF